MHLALRRLGTAVTALVAAGAASAQSPVGQWVTEVRAQETFAHVCVATFPSFDAAEARRVELGIDVPSRSETGLFYHRVLNLSIKVFSEGGLRHCSMVFGMIGLMPSTPSSFLPGMLAQEAAVGWTHQDLQPLTLITRGDAKSLVMGPRQVRPNLYHVMMMSEHVQ